MYCVWGEWSRRGKRNRFLNNSLNPFDTTYLHKRSHIDPIHILTCAYEYVYIHCMKGRESGMPDEGYWQTFFDAKKVLQSLVNLTSSGRILEFGSGYGTFTLPLAEAGHGVIGLDIETNLVQELNQIAHNKKMTNMQAYVRDFVLEGAGEAGNSLDHVLLYNILHIEDPVALLKEAWRILKPGTTASILHWRSDIPTPRGPSLEIRPTAEQCIQWAEQAGFHHTQMVSLEDSAPYHFGIIIHKP